MISAAQIRAGRSLLNVKQSELAKAAGVSLATLNNIERSVGDPRASTLEAIERALYIAGVDVESDGTTESLRLNRMARPSAYETLQASQKILELLSRKSLLNVERVLFYVRRDHLLRDGADALKLCALLEGRVRTVLFDQVSFTVSNSARMAETAGILLAAFALHDGALSYLDNPIEDTTLTSLPEAVGRLRDAPSRELTHPKPLLASLGDWDGLLDRYAGRADHPMHNLVRVVGPPPDTIALP